MITLCTKSELPTLNQKEITAKTVKYQNPELNSEIQLSIPKIWLESAAEGLVILCAKSGLPIPNIEEVTKDYARLKDIWAQLSNPPQQFKISTRVKSRDFDCDVCEIWASNSQY